MDENVLPTTKQAGGDIMINAETGAHIDTVGAAILGFLCFVLLLAYMRAQGRNRKLIEKIAKLER